MIDFDVPTKPKMNNLPIASNNKSSRPNRPVRFSPIGFTAFTLVETLVVVAIIGILAALIFAVVGRVRASADSAKSVSNLRGIGQMMAQYAAENGTAILPPDRKWDTGLVDFLDARDGVAIWKAPGDREARNSGLKWPGDVSLTAPARSYCLNIRAYNFAGIGGAYIGHQPDTGAKLVSIAKPSKLWVLSEFFQPKNMPYDLVMGQQSAAFMWEARALPNQKQVNVLFADGHVVSHPYKLAPDSWFRDENNGQ